MILVDLIEARARSQFLASVMAAAAGAKNVTITEPSEVRIEFDRLLRSDTKPGRVRDERTSAILDALFPKD